MPVASTDRPVMVTECNIIGLVVGLYKLKIAFLSAKAAIA